MTAVGAAIAFLLAGVVGVGTLGAGTAGGDPSAAAPELYVLSAQSDSIVRSSHPLFDGAILVPRASAHDRFAVRNGSADVAYLRIALTSVDVPDAALRRSLSLAASTAQASGPVVPLDAPGSCIALLAPQPVAPGATVEVDAALALGDLTGLSGQSEPIAFSMLVVLDADPAGTGCHTGGPGAGGGGGPPPSHAEHPAGSPLAATGSDLLAASWLAVALAGAGVATAVASRAVRRRGRRHGRPEEG